MPDKVTRLAYLRGDEFEIALAEEHLPGMKDVAKSLSLRRLAPVHGESPVRDGVDGTAGIA